MSNSINRIEGRHLFGSDPDGYDAVRPSYPDWIFDALIRQGSLFEGAKTLEIGPGSGSATRRLLEFGADPLTLIEPDQRFAEILALAANAVDANCSVVHQSFEAASLPPEHFDLVVAATAFHWVEPEQGLRKVRRILRNGGTAALMWNVLQDLNKEDPFHDATKDLLASLADSPSGAPDSTPFALDRAAREEESRAVGFSQISYSESRWSYVITTEQVGKLYEGFSSIQRLDDDPRNDLLQKLMAIAHEQFDGRVVRNMTSCLYLLQ